MRLFNSSKSIFPKRLTIWYVIWFCVASAYLYFHWNEAIAFSPFNGNSLILCVWIGMILKPFIGEIDTPWIKAKMNKAEVEAEQKESKENFEAMKKAEEEKKGIEQIKEKEAE